MPETLNPELESIAAIESGGNKDPYSVVGQPTKKGDVALGKYQIMQSNVPQWSKEAIGKEVTPQEFLKNPQIQDAVANHQWNQIRQKHNPEDAAKVWFGGEGGLQHQERKDVTGTSIKQYGQKFSKYNGGVTISPSAQEYLLTQHTSPSNFLDRINSDIAKGGEARDRAYRAYYELENKAKPPQERVFEAYSLNANQTPMNQVNNSFWGDLTGSVYNGIKEGWAHQKEAFTAALGKLGYYDNEEVKNKLNEIRSETAAKLVPLSPKAEMDIWNSETGINGRALAASTAKGLSEMSFVVAPAALAGALAVGTGGAATPLVAGLTNAELAASGIAGAEGMIDMFGQKYEEGRQRGLTHEQAQSYAGVTMPIGAIMGVPITGFLNQMMKPFANKVTEKALDYLIEKGFTPEAFAETNKIVTNGITDWIRERGARYIKSTAKESLLMGSTMGVMNALDNMATKYYAANSGTQENFKDVINKTPEQEIKDIAINTGMGIAMSAIMSSPEFMRAGRFETIYGLVDKNANNEGKIANIKDFVTKTAGLKGYTPETTAELLNKIEDMRNVASKYGKYVPSPEGRFQVYKLLQEQHLTDGQSAQIAEHLKQVTEDLKDNPPMLEQKTAEVNEVQKLLDEKKKTVETFMKEIGNNKLPLTTEQQRLYQEQITKLNGDIAVAMNKIYPDAVQKSLADASLLRETSEGGEGVGLPKVEQGNGESKDETLAQPKKEVGVAKTIQDILDVGESEYAGLKGVYTLGEEGNLQFIPQEGGKPIEFDKATSEQMLSTPLSEIDWIVGHDKELVQKASEAKASAEQEPARKQEAVKAEEERIKMQKEKEAEFDALLNKVKESKHETDSEQLNSESDAIESAINNGDEPAKEEAEIIIRTDEVMENAGGVGEGQDKGSVEKTEPALKREGDREGDGEVGEVQTDKGRTEQVTEGETDEGGEGDKGVKPAEKIVSAKELTPAIEVNGKVYEGANHGEAMDKAREAGEDVPDYRTPEGDKWRTENGKFKEQGTGEILTREQADKKYGISRTEELGKGKGSGVGGGKKYLAKAGNSPEVKTHNIDTAKSLLSDLGIDGSFSGYSDTNGVSVYFTDTNGKKIRVSNHGVTNKDRMANEMLLYFDTKTIGIGGKEGFKSYAEQNKKTVEQSLPKETKEATSPEIAKEESSKDAVGKTVTFDHAGTEKTGVIKSVDAKTGEYKVVGKTGGRDINYTVKPENARFQKSSAGEVISSKTAKVIDKVLKKAFAGIKTTFLSGEEFKAKHGTDALGVTNPDGTIDLNRDKITAQTQVHEFGHIWNTWAKKFATDLYKKGLELAAKETELIDRVKKESPELEGDRLLDEVIARSIGEKGEPMIEELPTGLKAWVNDLWNRLTTFVKNRLGIKDTRFDHMENMTFNEFTAKLAKELLSGKEISPLTSAEIASLDEAGISRFMKDDRVRRGLEEREATLKLEGGKLLGAAYNFVGDVGDVVGFTRGEDVIYTHPTTGKEEKRRNIIYNTKEITDNHVTQLKKIFGKKINRAIDSLDLNKDGSANNMVSGRNLVDARKFILENPEKFDKAIRSIAEEVVNPKNGSKFDFSNLPQDSRKILSTLGAALVQADHMETIKDGIFVRPNEIVANKEEYSKSAQNEVTAWDKRKAQIAAKSPVHKLLVEGWDVFNNLTAGIRDWAVGISGQTSGKWAETARSIQRAASNEIAMQTELGNILKPFIKNDKYKNGSITVSGGVLNTRMILGKPLDRVNGANAREIFKDDFMPDNYKITDMEQINIIGQIDGRPDLKKAAWEREGGTLPIYIQESGNREGKVLYLTEKSFNELKERWKDDIPKWKEMWKKLFNEEYNMVNPIHQSQTGLNLLRIQNPTEVTFTIDGKEMKGILKSEGEFGNIVKGEDGKTYDLKEDEILSRTKRDDIYYHMTAHGKGKDAIKTYSRMENHLGDMSSFKERALDAENPILIMDEFQMLQTRINNSSKYASWALPMHNGEVMTNVYGKDVLSRRQKEHWNEFKAGLMNPPEKNIGTPEKMFYKGFVQYALGINPFTALKHISTLVLANNVVPQKYILSSLSEFPKAGRDIVKNFDILSGDEKSWNPVMERMLKSNFGLLRATGNAAEIQALIDGGGKVRIKTSKGDVDFSGKDTLTMMKSIETATDAVIWRAVEKYVEAEFPTLKEGTQEHTDKVEQLFMDAINDSQPSFDYANRSLLSTRSGVINRAFTVFSGQLTAQWNAFSRRATVSMNNPTPRNYALTAKSWANVFIANAAIIGAIDVLRQQALGKTKEDEDLSADYLRDVMREQAAGLPFIGRLIQEGMDKAKIGQYAVDVNAPVLEPIHDITSALSYAIKDNPEKALMEMKDFGEKAIGFPGIIDKTVTKAIK